MTVSELAAELAETALRKRAAWTDTLSDAARSAGEFGSSALQRIGTSVAGMPPELRNALIGAALGGTVGAASSMLRKKKRPWRDAATLAALGALAGGGGTLFLRGINPNSYSTEERLSELTPSGSILSAVNNPIGYGALAAGVGAASSVPIANAVGRHRGIRTIIDQPAPETAETARELLGSIVAGQPTTGRLGADLRRRVLDAAIRDEFSKSPGWLERMRLYTGTGGPLASRIEASARRNLARVLGQEAATMRDPEHPGIMRDALAQARGLRRRLPQAQRASHLVEQYGPRLRALAHGNPGSLWWRLALAAGIPTALLTGFGE